MRPCLHVCRRPECPSQADSPTRTLHQQDNLFLSRLDEQRRRWYAARTRQRRANEKLRLQDHSLCPQWKCTLRHRPMSEAAGGIVHEQGEFEHQPRVGEQTRARGNV